MRRYGFIWGSRRPRKRVFVANCLVALLPEMCADEGDELQLDVYLPGPQGPAEGGPGHPVRQLRVQGLCVVRLNDV